MSSVETARRSKRSSEIVAEGRAHLLEAGVDGFIMRRVAERADMALGNLQYYYPSRDDLLEAIVRAEFANDLAAAQAPGNGGEAALGTTIERLIRRWANREGSVYLAVGSLAQHNRRFADLWNAVYNEFYEVLGRFISATDASLSKRELRERAMLVTSILDGASVQVSHGISRTRFQRSATDLAIGVATGQLG